MLPHTPSFFFFFNDPAPTEIYPLPLHDALPIFSGPIALSDAALPAAIGSNARRKTLSEPTSIRSEEHTSELQSRSDLVCRLLLEKKKYTCNGTSRRLSSSTTSYITLHSLSRMTH